MLKIYRYFNYLSLDVAGGAALLSAGISKFITNDINWNISMCLGIAVWIIYTFDHLVDAYRSEKKPTIQRHIFHQHHCKKLIAMLILSSLTGMYLVSKLPNLTIWYGAVLLLFVAIYFLIIYFFKQFYLKEVLVAVVYAVGVFLGTLSAYSVQVDFSILNFFLQLLVIAFLNLTFFSVAEYEMDVEDDHASLARKFGNKIAANLIKILLIILIVWQTFSLIWLGFSSFQFLFLVMTIVFSVTFVLRRSLKKNERYRWLADAIFFIPAIELLF